MRIAVWSICRPRAGDRCAPDRPPTHTRRRCCWTCRSSSDLSSVAITSRGRVEVGSNPRRARTASSIRRVSTRDSACSRSRWRHRREYTQLHTAATGNHEKGKRERRRNETAHWSEADRGILLGPSSARDVDAGGITQTALVGSQVHRHLIHRRLSSFE